MVAHVEAEALGSIGYAVLYEGRILGRSEYGLELLGAAELGESLLKRLLMILNTWEELPVEFPSVHELEIYKLKISPYIFF